MLVTGAKTNDCLLIIIHTTAANCSAATVLYRDASVPKYPKLMSSFKFFPTGKDE